MKESLAERAERIKREKDGLDVLVDILRYAKTNDPLDAEDVERFKWYGIYPQRQEEDELPRKYMMRIKTVDGSLTVEHLRTLGNISIKYAENTADFTTRQNVQIHNVQFQSFPHIFDELARIGLSSVMACGDVPRSLVSCPLNGIDHTEIIDVTDLLYKVSELLNGNRKFSNLPRKFKVGISGCSNYCMGHEIQDLSFVALRHPETNEILFDVTVGGGLGKDWHFAKRIGKHVRAQQIPAVVEETLNIFNESGKRDKRHKARIKVLINEWGTAKFTEELEHRLGYTLQNGSEPIIPKERYRNHFGIHESRQEGRSFIGFATLRGKVSGTDLVAIADKLDKYVADSIRITTNQNFLVPNVPAENAEKLAADIVAIGYHHKPTPFRAGTLACTGLEFCRLAVSETKDTAQLVVEHLERELPDFNEDLRISLNGCPNSCAHYPIVDVGLVGAKFKRDGQNILGYEVNLGGHLGGSKSVFVKTTKTKLAPEEIGRYIKTLLEEYQANRSENETVQDYLERTVVEGQ